MTNAEALQVVSEEMLKVAPVCSDCGVDTALYQKRDRAVCYDCAPDKTELTELGQAYRALERRWSR